MKLWTYHGSLCTHKHILFSLNAVWIFVLDVYAMRTNVFNEKCFSSQIDVSGY